MESWLAYACCTCVLINILTLCLGIPSTNRSTYSTFDGNICYKCRPGQHLVENCTISGEDAKCRPCPSGTFQSDENIAQNCTKCTLLCNNVYKKLISNCSETKDIICQCVSGFFSAENTCKRHRTCPPGEGVKKEGNTNTDTVCEQCIEGISFSSNDSATEACKSCTRCEKQGYSDVAQCTRKNDTTCRKPPEPQDSLPSWIVPVSVGSLLVIGTVGSGGVYCFLKKRKTWTRETDRRTSREMEPLNSNERDGQSAMSQQPPSPVDNVSIDNGNSVTGVIGGSVTLTKTVTITKSTTVTWLGPLRNVITSGPKYTSSYNCNTGKASLTIQSLNTNDVGNYTCRVSDSSGTQLEKSIYVTTESSQTEDQRRSEGMPNQSERNSFNEHNNENVSDSDTTNPPNLMPSEPAAIGGSNSSSGPVVTNLETGPSVNQQEGDIYFSEGKPVLRGHFDACIIYAEADDDDVNTFKLELEGIKLDDGLHPRICRYNDEIWSYAGLAKKAQLICDHCTLIFVYLSDNFKHEDYANFLNNQAVMISIRKCNVRPVFSKKDCVVPVQLNNSTRIDWYMKGSRSYEETIVNIFKQNVVARLQREAKKIESTLAPY